MVLHPLMKSPAWRDLTGNAVKLVLHLMMLSQGNNGWGHKEEQGELFLSERDAASAIGVSRNTASKAFSELIAHGFLRPVRRGHFHVKLKIATVWRLTFQPYPRAHQGPTNEWRNWRPEEKSRAQELNGSGSKSGHCGDADAFTGAETGPVKMGIAGNPPSHVGSIIAPHLDIPRGCSTAESGWWGTDAALRARVSSRLATLAWLTGSPEGLPNNQSASAATSVAA